MQSANKPEFVNDTPGEEPATVLELLVNNHPGVMSHICGLFSRRVYNVEGIVCVPVGTGERSIIRLRLKESEKLPQVVKQLQKLPDVYTVIQWDGDEGFLSGFDNQGNHQED